MRPRFNYTLRRWERWHATRSLAEEQQMSVLRRLPAWRKLELLGDACDTNRALMMAGLRSRLGNLSETELRRRLMDLLFGREMAEKIWGPDRTSPL